MMFARFISILLVISVSKSIPIDTPVHIDLPVYDQPELGSTVRLAESLQLENYGGGDTRSGKATPARTSLFKHKFDTPDIKSITQPGSINYVSGLGYFAAPVTTLEGALLETEDFGSKKQSFKENIQQVVAGILQPKPIVDTITEDEKYGNNGDKFYRTGRVIVDGAASVSNLVNTVLEVPGAIFKKISRVASEKLNNLGGKLIGL